MKVDSATEKVDVSPELPTTGRSGEPRAACGTPGLVLGGKYQLIAEIGRGGMGTVWRAERLGWHAPVAVKMMSVSANARARARFEREVRLAAGLRSPHVVQVLDHGVDESSGYPFIVMELLEGESLAARLRRLRVLSPGEVMRIVTHVARALSRAHDAGIVHRDLKPDNVYLVSNGDDPIVKILDFGVAKWLDPGGLDSKALTRPGRTIGTPFYMSPEQFRGTVKLDHRQDLWSLAIIACECLTGKRPFDAQDFPSLALLLCGEGPRPVASALSPVPLGFDEWFGRGTDPDIARRFQSAQELADELRPICGSAPDRMPPLVLEHDAALPHLPTMAPLTRTSEGHFPMLRRRPVLTASLALGATAGLIANLVVYRPWEGATSHVEPSAAGHSPSTQNASLLPASPVATSPSLPASPDVPMGALTAPVQPSPAQQPAPAHGTPAASDEPLREKAAPKKRETWPNRTVAKAKIAQPTPSQPESEEATIENDRIIRTSL